RLRRTALDRVGGLGHGSRLGSAGCARLRSPHGLRAVGDCLRRRDAALRRMSASDLREIGIGMLGYGFMGKAHSNAYRKIAYMTGPPPLMPKLVAIFGRTEVAVAEAARRYGYGRRTTDWR